MFFPMNLMGPVGEGLFAFALNSTLTRRADCGPRGRRGLRSATFRSGAGAELAEEAR